jgi:hypothetical protein
MIRGIDNRGCIILGITARELDGLLAGERCCFVASAPQAPGPHICLWFGETDADLLAKLGEMYPQGAPVEVGDYRAQPRPDYGDPSRLTWEYYDNLCKTAERYGTRQNAGTAAHIERLRVQIVALRGERGSVG